MTLAELKQKRASALNAAKKIRDDAKVANRDLSDDEVSAIQGHVDEAGRLKAEIGKREKGGATLDALDAELADIATPAPRATAPGTEGEQGTSHQPQRVQSTRNLADQDPQRGFKSFGEFAAVVRAAGAPGGMSAMDPRLRPLAAAQGNNTITGSEGGFLTPGAYSTVIWDGLNQDPMNLLTRCDQYPIEGQFLEMPANAETSRANGSRYGGVQVYRVKEGDQATATKPKFRNLRLEAKKLTAMVYATDELLSQYAALGAYLTKAMISEFGYVVSDEILNGIGGKQALGLMKSGSLVTVAAEGSQAADTILQENISKMWARLHPRCRANAAWYLNVDCEPQLDALTTKVKNVAGSENVGGLSNLVYNAEKGLLKGRPIIWTEQCATLGDLGDIVLADLSYYAAGVRGSIKESQSIHLRFDYGETAFKWDFFMDGQPWMQAALTPAKGANTLSSHVTLAAR